MLRHINRSLKLPDGRPACEIETEGDAERIAADLIREAEGIEAQVTATEEKQAAGRKVDRGWLYRARRAAQHRRDAARSIKGALKVMRREDHQRREALNIAAGRETPEQKRERVELAAVQQETDNARFVVEARSRLPHAEYLSIWGAVRAQDDDPFDDPDIGGRAVDHLRAMYPAALEAVPKTAATSLRNFINNRVRAALAAHREDSA